MDQRLFAPTHGLSQLIASFIASVSQGIRHAPFITFSPHTSLTQKRGHARKTRKGTHAAGHVAHTFSCIRLTLKPAGMPPNFTNYSLACVNMSKIDAKGGRATPPGKTGRVPEDPHGEVENNGFEPLTPCLQSRCSSQLS